MTSPIWQFNYVIVPRDYVPNSLRSERDCLRSGYASDNAAMFSGASRGGKVLL